VEEGVGLPKIIKEYMQDDERFNSLFGDEQNTSTQTKRTFDLSRIKPISRNRS
jgi:hypothetical protein